VELFVNSSAWQAARTATFFLAVSTALAGVTGNCQGKRAFDYSEAIPPAGPKFLRKAKKPFEGG